MTDYKIGDSVDIECYTSMGSPSTEIVTDIKTRYREDTGKEFKVICFGKHEFDAEHRTALTPPTMYFMLEKEEPISNEDSKNWIIPCGNCGAKPTVTDTALCGPCCFGEADTVNGNW